MAAGLCMAAKDAIVPNNGSPSATLGKDRGTTAAQQPWCPLIPASFTNAPYLRRILGLVTTETTRGCGIDRLQTGWITRAPFRARASQIRSDSPSRRLQRS